MRNKIICLLACICIGSGSAVNAEEVAVIVNAANNQSLSKMQVAAIYSDQLTTWHNGERIHVFQLPVQDEAREVFSQAILSRSARRVEEENASRKITNSFRNPPVTKRARLVSIYVARDEHAIAYVPLSLVKGNTRIRILFTLK